jgi:tRNA U55 pseudouridine synthase TruB
MLDTLHRTGSGIFGIEKSMTLETLKEVSESGSSWADLPGFVSFDRLLDGFSRADASFQEAEAIVQGKQQYLPSILEKRKSGRSALNAHGGVVAGHENHIVIYFEDRLLAVAALENGSWGLERVFPEALTQAAPV